MSFGASTQAVHSVRLIEAQADWSNVANRRQKKLETTRMICTFGSVTRLRLVLFPPPGGCCFTEPR